MEMFVCGLKWIHKPIGIVSLFMRFALFFQLTILALALVAAIGLGVPVMDVDAAQYAAMAERMSVSGEWLQLFDRGAPYLDKPPLLFWLSATIAVGIIVSVALSAIVGSSIPLLLHLNHLDPKVASGPVVLTISDVITTALYLFLATLWLL